MNSDEIARLANVSRSTVSRVINNYKNVPESTRKKVQEIIDKYGYTPNVSARVLAGKTNNVIGVFIGNVGIDINDDSSGTLPYNAELIVRIIQNCKKKGYMVLVDTITEVSEYFQIEEFFRSRMLFGGVFVGFPYRFKEIEELSQKKYNIVLIDQLQEKDDKEKKVNFINCDNFLGGYLVTKYLIDMGHKSILHIEGDNRLSAIERREGYIAALKEAGIKMKENMIISGEYLEEKAYISMKKFLEKDTPTAIFAGNDTMALGAYHAIREKGLEVPKDISIVGFDNLRLWKNLSLEDSKFLNELTSVEIDMKELADNIVELLFLKGEKVHKYCIPKIIEKKSVIKLED